jgi:hypothetical protein
MSIQKKPAARQIQPTGFLRRLDAIRAPTMGKAQKGTKINRSPRASLSDPPENLLRGTGEDIERDASCEHGRRETGKRPCQPCGSAGAHPTDSLVMFPCPFCHSGPILRLFHLLFVTKGVRRPWSQKVVDIIGFALPQVHTLSISWSLG